MCASITSCPPGIPHWKSKLTRCASAVGTWGSGDSLARQECRHRATRKRLWCPGKGQLQLSDGQMVAGGHVAPDCDTEKRDKTKPLPYTAEAAAVTTAGHE